jgi:hypothetical protein
MGNSLEPLADAIGAEQLALKTSHKNYPSMERPFTHSMMKRDAEDDEGSIASTGFREFRTASALSLNIR